MKNAVIVGTFDPVTIGHLSIIRRAAEIFENVYVGVCENSEKRTMFSFEKRLEAMTQAVNDIPNVTPCNAGSMTVADFARKHNAVIVKGIRNGSDADYEISLSQINTETGGVETILLATNPEHSFISSTFVREMIKYNKPFSKYVPNGVDKLLK